MDNFTRWLWQHSMHFNQHHDHDHDMMMMMMFRSLNVLSYLVTTRTSSWGKLLRWGSTSRNPESRWDHDDDDDDHGDDHDHEHDGDEDNDDKEAPVKQHLCLSSPFWLWQFDLNLNACYFTHAILQQSFHKITAIFSSPSQNFATFWYNYEFSKWLSTVIRFHCG